MNRSQAFLRSQGFLVGRVLLYGAFFALWIVWLWDPASPTPPYRRLVIAWFAAVLLPLALPRARAAWLGALRRRSRALDLLAVNLALLLVLAESSLRLVAAVVPSPILVSPNAKAEEMIRDHRLLPGSDFKGFRVNSLGFVDQEFRREREPGVGRIVALGDSFAVGQVQYEENFLTLLDDLLDRGSRWEVLNFGVAGVSPREYLQLYRTEGRYYDPDLVLLCFFNGNDFRDLRPSSLLHSDALYLFNVPRRLLALSSEPKWVHNQTENLGEDTFRGIELERVKIAARALDHTSERRYRATFQQLREVAAEIGDKLRVVIIPDEYQVNPQLLPSLLGSAGAVSAYDLDQPTRRMREFLDREGIAYLDLLEPLRRAEASAHTYIPSNTHWNALGNRVAADAIAGWLAAGWRAPAGSSGASVPGATSSSGGTLERSR